MAQRSRITFETSAEDDGDRLDRVVHRHLAGHLSPPPSRADARRLVEGGRVRVNDRLVRRSSERLAPSARVEVDLDPADLARAAADRAGRVDLDPSRILHEDDVLLAVDKPAGLPSHATRDPARDHLVAAVARMLEARDGRPPPPLHLAHRLDADTSGAVLLTKSPRANTAVGEAFRDRRVIKVYRTVVVAHVDLPEAWTVQDNLRWDRGQGRMVSVRAGGDPAHTDFRLLERRGDLAEVEARPRTGRTHQIRVHLSEAGTPILGDRIYGDYDASHGSDRLLLHSKRIELLHPLTGAPVHVESPLPNALLLASRQ